MKEQFKYGIGEQSAMNLGRPILSTRQTFSTHLQKKALEEKVLETLKSKNEYEKYEEFKSAQKLAATMMEIVSSNQSEEMILDAKNCKSMSKELSNALRMNEITS